MKLSCVIIPMVYNIKFCVSNSFTSFHIYLFYLYGIFLLSIYIYIYIKFNVFLCIYVHYAILKLYGCFYDIIKLNCTSLNGSYM